MPEGTSQTPKNINVQPLGAPCHAFLNGAEEYETEEKRKDESERTNAVVRRTAVAVLSYKRKRNVIDRRRQGQADDIVGKLTITLLDAEILVLEALKVYREGLPNFITVQDLKSGKVGGAGTFQLDQALATLKQVQGRVASS